MNIFMGEFNAIQDLAIDVLRKYWDGKLPINIKDIVKALDVNLIERFEHGTITPPDGISPKADDGALDISGRFDYVHGKPVITVRTTDTLERQRFTIAHELGHYLLGHQSGFRDNTLSFDMQTQTKRAEIDANNFAAELLMPEHLVNHLIDFEKISSPELLAKRFGVSVPAMMVRLKKLKWL